MGRLKHFAWITDYRTCITSNKKLLEARELVEQYRYMHIFILLKIHSTYRNGSEPEGVTKETVW